MADLSYDRTIINVLEKPASSDINQAQSQQDRVLRDFLSSLFSRRFTIGSDIGLAPDTGFLGDAFKVRAEFPPSKTVLVTPGVGYFWANGDVPASIGGVAGLDDLSPYKPMPLAAVQSLVAPDADPVNPRIDIVEVRYDRHVGNLQSRDVFNGGTNSFAPNVINKTLGFGLDGLKSVNGSAAINYKTGTPGGVPVAPALSAGYVLLAKVLVPALAPNLSDFSILDERALLAPAGAMVISGTFRMTRTGAGGTAFTTNLSSLNAPPGVRVAAIGISNPSAGIWLFLQPGNAALWKVNATATPLTGQIGGAPFFNDTVVISEVAQVAIDAPTQTLLFDGVHSTPIQPFAVGQPTIRVAFDVMDTGLGNIATFTNNGDFVEVAFVATLNRIA